MPLWKIYHPPTTFTTPASKSAFAASITRLYTAINLPAFYVVVTFLPVPPSDIYVGGAPRSATAAPFIRIVVAHIAVRQPDDDAAYKRVRERIEGVVGAHMGVGWEYEWHVEESERRLWMVCGFEPPGFGSEGERLWVRENRAVAWE